MTTFLEAIRAIATFLLVQTGLRQLSNTTNDELIPRTLLFSNPERSGAKLSPDGRYIAFFAPNDKGVQNIWVQPTIAASEPIQLTFDNGKGIHEYHWTYMPNVLLFSQDNDGDENYRLYKVDISNTRNREPDSISAQPGVQAFVMAVGNRQMNKLIIGANDDNPAYHSMYEFDLSTNQKRRILNNSRFSMYDMRFDNNLNLRIVGEATNDGGKIYYHPSNAANPRNLTSSAGDWTPYTTVSPEDYDITKPISFSPDNTQIYWIWGPGSDLGRLAVHPFGRPNENRFIYSPQKSEINQLRTLVHPRDKTVLAVVEQYHKQEVKVLNDTVRADFDYLQRMKTDGTPLVADTSEDFMTWLIEYYSDQYPLEYWLYDRRQQKLKFLFSKQPQLKGKKVANMHGVTVTARDGLPIPCFLSIPPMTAMSAQDPTGIIPNQPQKLIFLVHGGPNFHDDYGFITDVVWLTNRNYAVMQCNYRGSTGYGKRHKNAGNGEWGGKMHDDLLDAADWAVSKGIADPQQIAIMGISYGGYETLIGLTFTPDKFSCGVDIIGPSNLLALLETIPPYWAAIRKGFTIAIGADTDTEAGRQFLRSRSPLFFAQQVKKPILIFQGGKDPRVKRNTSDQFVKALQDNRIPVTYIVYPNEGHGFQRPENTLSYAGFTEKFLADCLHGRYEPYRVGMYNSSAIVVADTSK